MNLTMHLIRQILNDGQSQTGTFNMAVLLFVESMERSEEIGKILLLNTDTRITNGETKTHDSIPQGLLSNGHGDRA